MRFCGGVRSALILDPAIDAPGLTRADGCRICFRSMQNYPTVFIRRLCGFPWYRVGFRPEHRHRGIALRTAAAGYQAEPVGDELLPRMPIRRKTWR